MFKPLAAAICFGLLYGTLLVLVVIPVLLSLVMGGGERVRGWRRRMASGLRHAASHAPGVRAVVKLTQETT